MWLLYVLCFVGGFVVGALTLYILAINALKYAKEKYIDNGLVTADDMYNYGYNSIMHKRKEKKSNEKEN